MTDSSIEYAVSSHSSEVVFVGVYLTGATYRQVIFEKDGENAYVIVRMSTDGTKTFSLDGIVGFEPEDVELVDSGITTIHDSNYLTGWVSIRIFSQTFENIEIENIKYTKGGF